MAQRRDTANIRVLRAKYTKDRATQAARLAGERNSKGGPHRGRTKTVIAQYKGAGVREYCKEGKHANKRN